MKINHKPMKQSIKDKVHLSLVGQLPCILSGRDAEVAHIRYGSLEYNKPQTGLGIKPHDKWVLPLAPELHRLLSNCQHDSNEQAWWRQFNIDPLYVAELLYGKNLAEMELIIQKFTPRGPYKEKVREILTGKKEKSRGKFDWT